MHCLELENFHSIRGRQFIDLRIAGNVPDPGRRFAEVPGGRVPRIVAFFGANASGKSNVLRGLSAISWFLQHSARLEPGEPLPFERFAARDAAVRPTVLAACFGGPRELPVEFRRGAGAPPEVPYRYEVAFRNSPGVPATVLHERLDVWPAAGGRCRNIFRRDEAGRVTGTRMFPVAHFEPALKVVRPNASVISTLGRFDHVPSLVIRSAAARVFTNVPLERHGGAERGILRCYLDDPGLLHALNEDLKHVDIGIRAVTPAPGERGPVLLCGHEGLAHPLPLQLQSHGTRQFLRIYPAIRAALDEGGIAVLDEVDGALHPLVLPGILRWFTDPHRNPRGAQIWFSCRSVALLDFLDKEEVFFCEKDAGGRTAVYGLRDVKDVRRSDNFMKKYLGGRYGALPRCGSSMRPAAPGLGPP